MNIACPNPANGCVDPASPISNYSSESDDGPRFYGRNYNPPPWPPIGGIWRAPSCVGECVSFISQQDADECAQRANLTCLGDDWPPADPPRLVFLNDAQSCEFVCQDGLTFVYTIPAGTFAAFSQVEADAIAYSIACNRANELHVCISALTVSAWCLNQFNIGTVDFTGLATSFTSSIVSGSLPPGISYFQDNRQGVFSGTPTSAGAFTFALKVEDGEGNSMTKNFTINVVQILPATMPSANSGVAYSQDLSTNVGSAGSQTWSIVSGALPDGLTLNASTGLISGTPTLSGAFAFTVRVVDSSL